MTSPHRPPPSAQLLGLGGWLLLCFVAAGIGALASADAPAFYAQLDRPAWAPPARVFGPVWSLLYTLMALAAWRVWREPPSLARARALALFVAQLAANALWSWLFFAWHRGAAAAAEVLVLWVLILLTVLAFWRRSRAAGALLLPYLAWVGFAAALTWSTWLRNPGLL